MKTLDVVVGGQFGSEAKGHVTKKVLLRHLIERPWGLGFVNVRVAGPNAGHCVLDGAGNKFALRTIPVGAVLSEVHLVIAAGSEVDPQVLADEIAELTSKGHNLRGRLYVSAEATVLTPQHREAEAGMQARMGSTGKGIGAARADRIMRTATRVGDDPALVDLITEAGGVVFFGPQPFGMRGMSVVIEGTQGYGLGLHAGYYPQCTSSDCRAIDFAAMAGLNPWDAEEFTPWVVARVYPIRVAGNSGPLKGESSWEDLGLPQEFTTVTKKVRRVGEWDADLISAAMAANGSCARLAVTMLDQKFGETAGLDNTMNPSMPLPLPAEAAEFLHELPGVDPWRISLVTTGEDTGVWR